MNLYVRFLRSLVRSSFGGTGGAEATRARGAEDRPRAAPRHRARSIAIGIVVPAVVGCLMLPFRDSLDVSAAIVFVLPTLFVALARGPVGAMVAAAVSAAMYDLLFTEPFYSLRINSAAEVVAMVVLFVAAAVVGVTSANLRDMTWAASSRRTDVDAFVAITAPGLDAAERAAVTCRGLTAVLDATSTRWMTGYHGSVDPLLQRNGTVAGKDHGALPPSVEIPAKVGRTELGRFVVRSSGNDTSLEQRAAARALVDVFARFAPDSDSVGPVDHREDPLQGPQDVV